MITANVRKKKEIGKVQDITIDAEPPNGPVETGVYI